VLVAGIGVAVACGGSTSPGARSDAGSDGASSSSSGSSSGGGSGSSSGVTTGCPGNFTTTPSMVDPNLCAPQVASVTSCAGQVCSFTVEIPCPPDAGSMACADACKAAFPDAGAPSGFCNETAIDGGSAVLISCGGCGV